MKISYQKSRPLHSVKRFHLSVDEFSFSTYVVPPRQIGAHRPALVLKRHDASHAQQKGAGPC